MSRHRLQLAAVLLLSVLVLAACQVQPEHYHRPSGPNRGGSGTASTPLAEGFDFYTQRRVINVKVGPKQYFPVRFPRFNAGVYARLNNNTCGKWCLKRACQQVAQDGSGVAMWCSCWCCPAAVLQTHGCAGSSAASIIQYDAKQAGGLRMP